jgi:hypothetical protein
MYSPSLHTKSKKEERTCNSTFLDTLETTEQQYLPKYAQALAKRTIKKRSTLENTFALIDVPSTPLKKGYWETFHCSEVLLQEGKKIHTSLCRRKWCKVCANIRTSELVNGYKHLLEEFEDPCLVTVTQKNCKGRELKAEYNKMLHAFQWARRTIQRQNGIKLNGIRSWECTHNEEEDTYHPHFHIVMDGHTNGEAFIKHWMHYWNEKRDKGYTNREAQHIEQLTTSNDLVEAFKYTTKMDSDTPTKATAQDWIYQCTKGKRLAQPFGTLKRAKISHEKQITEAYQDIDERNEIWAYELNEQAFINAEGEYLVTDEQIETYKANQDAKTKARQSTNRTSPSEGNTRPKGKMDKAFRPKEKFHEQRYTGTSRSGYE